MTGATFALFTSQAQAETDTFNAGTVILSGNGPTCTFANMEAGDSHSCTYTVTYKGSLDAWITLSASAESTAVAAYTPVPGSQTMIGGEALLNDVSPNGLQVAITDNQGAGTAPMNYTVGALSCTNIGSGSALGDPGYQDQCKSPGTPAQVVIGQGPHAVSDCAATNSCISAGGDGSVTQGWTDTFTVTGTLPLAAGNIYQGGTATVTLQAQAVQASNNDVVPPPAQMSFVSNNTWLTYTANPSSTGAALLGNAEEVCLTSTVPYPCPPGGVIYGYPAPSGVWTAPLTAIPGALWIWAPGVTGSTPTTTDTTNYFSKTIYVPAPVVSGTVSVHVAVDNYAAVFVNGTLVGQVGQYGVNYDPTFNSTKTITVPGTDFVTGPNVITVEGNNALNSHPTYQDNPAGVVFGGTLLLK